MLEPGTRLGPYTIVELVAVGGMGEVYRATDARLHRDVAIKVLPSRLANDRASLERFQREARAVAALSHPNILSIFDYGEEEGLHYAVTELLEGETLRARLQRGRLEPREALHILRAIADGVAAAHARGIVHRDLKPENIFITRDGRVKVLDFGIARAPSDGFAAAGAYAPTEPGVVLGTLGYLAPEQMEGRPVTPATDVFALGCLLYEMVEGRLPFSGTSAAHSIAALLRDPAPRTEDAQVDAIVQRCLQKNPDDRFQSAQELRSAAAGPPLSKAAATLPHSKTVIAIITVLAIAFAFFALHRARNRQLDHGYDLRVSDIRGDAETRRLIELALRADAEGNRPKAMELLEEAWRRPAKTAFPAAFLSSFNDAAGNDARAEQWGTEAKKRLAGASPYESLLVRYLTLPSYYSSAELALAKSVLELRPGAWRLRLAAAHVHLGQRDREAARRELQAIDVTRPDDRRLMLVLADRASLGDIDGAERDLRASRLMRRPAMRHYTEARIAWSRGQIARAHERFERAAEEAATESLTPLEVEARLHAGVALVRMKRWHDAQRRLAITATRARQVRLEHRVFESTALAAYCAHRAGDVEERDRKLAEAAALQPPTEPGIALRLLAIRLGSAEWMRWSIDALRRDPQLAGTLSLIRAREAAFAGRSDDARRELRRAYAQGIEKTEHREEAELLAHELGLSATVLPPDPPYPNLLRYLAIFDLQERISIGTGTVR